MVSERDPWSVGLGRWAGIDVRLHLSFLVAILFVFLLAWRESMDSETSLAGLTVLVVLVWFLSVLLHELGHCIVDHPLGGTTYTILLTPVGGMRFERLHRGFSHETIPILAGPMVSATVTLVCFALVRSRQVVPIASLMHPETLQGLLADQGEDRSWFLAACRFAVCINAWIVVCNLLPAFPFDAARGCMTLLRRIYPQWDGRRATLWMCIVSRGIALLLLLSAVILHETPVPTVIPFWLVLVVLSLSIYFSTRGVEERLAAGDEEDDLLGYDFSQGYTSLERGSGYQTRADGTLPDWFGHLRRQWQQRQARREADEDLRVDSILARLHADGLQSLSPAERALLRRVSARYRSRQSK